MVFLQAEAGAGLLGPLLPFLIMMAVFYFFLIRPQQQQQRKRREMLENLKAGDRVITVGGIHGEITAVKDDEVQLRIADKVEIRMSRQGIGHIKGRD